MRDIKIGEKTIGINHKPFIIAEMSGNHNQSLDKALEIVDAVAKTGADALKLQTYTADSLTINVNHGDFTISDKKSLWYGRSLYDLYNEAHTPLEWHEEIFKRAEKHNLICFSTPFDDKAVDLLEKLGAPIYKIASFENNHLPLLKRIAQTKKPVIMSTGISSLSTIEDAVGVLKENGCEDVVLLKCTSTYPATPENTNIRTIPHMKELFQTHVGLSDHTMGIGASVASVALGARVIEKHFTISRAEGGVDSAFSLEPDEFRSLVVESSRAFDSLGEVKYGIMKDEINSLTFKRSIYVVEDIKKGESFNNKNLKIIRPGLGVQPKFLEIFIGKQANCDIKKGTALQFDYLV
jgi:pseudaminic acid synthase